MRVKLAPSLVMKFEIRRQGEQSMYGMVWYNATVVPLPILSETIFDFSDLPMIYI